MRSLKETVAADFDHPIELLNSVPTGITPVRLVNCPPLANGRRLPAKCLEGHESIAGNQVLCLYSTVAGVA